MKRIYNLSRTTAAMMIGVAALSVSAYAQDTSGKDAARSDKDSSKANDVQIEDIIVTAQRRSQAISQVPISVLAIGSQQLERSGPVDTTMMLTRLSPSLSFAQGPTVNGVAFSMRGVSSKSLEGGIQPSIAVIRDGVPLYRQGELVGDLIDVESIEILRGPQGTLFGKNSSAGVINITTRRPDDNLGGYVQGGATNDEEYFVNGALNIPVTDAIRTRWVGFYRDQNPIGKNYGPSGDILGAKSYGFSGKIDADISDSVNLLVSGGFAYRRASYGQQITIAPPAGFDTPGGNLMALATGLTFGYGNDKVNIDAPNLQISDSRYIQAEFNWEASDAVTLTSITSYREFRSSYAVDTDSTPFGFVMGSGFRPNPFYPFVAITPLKPVSPDNTKYGSQEIRLHYKGGRADIVTGAYFQTATTRSHTLNPNFFNGALIGADPNQFYVIEPRYRYKLDNDTAALFGDITYDLSDQFTTFAGLRYTHETISEYYHSDIYNFVPASTLDPVTMLYSIPPSAVTDFTATGKINNLSGRAGIQWRPTDGQNYYASFNRGYKGPAANTGRAAINTDVSPAIVKPEIATSYEIGTKQRLFDNRLSLGLSLYWMKIKNLQQAGTVPGSTTQNLQSVGDLKSKGAEFQAQWQVTNDLRLGGSVDYTDANYSGDNAIVACPTIFVCPGNGADIPAGSESLAGMPAIDTPKWAFGVTADYSHEVGSAGTVLLAADYSWRSKILYGLNQDPRTIERSHGFLNASISFISNQGWEVQIYGRNLTNEFYYTKIDFGVSRRRCHWLPEPGLQAVWGHYRQI